MLIRKSPLLRWSDVTPKTTYLDRRQLLSAAVGAGLAFRQPLQAAKLNAAKSPLSTAETPSSIKEITTYNNYYEFGTDKSDPAKNAGKFITSPWTVSVEGNIEKPQKFDTDSLRKLAPLEERIYRHRCVERWSIVVPWIGFSLAELIKRVQPTAKAKYLAFQTYYEPKQMPLGGRAGIQLPYVEGLRMDEAMHPLALLCFGLYGDTLLNQNGAPVRLVIPWKYGFKSIKSIIRIRFVEKEPPCTWNITNPPEYGFYANVNPDVDHPRWSQKQERRLGEFRMRPTVKFNGYGDQVASLYNGMDLKKYY